MVDAGMTADDVKTPLENGKVLAPALQRVGGIAPYCLWLLLTAGAFYWRPPTAPVELETLATAWHMWTHGLWLPLRNDLPAPQMPPLQLWLILAGWKMFGIATWWPRLLSPVNAWTPPASVPTPDTRRGTAAPVKVCFNTTPSPPRRSRRVAPESVMNTDEP